MEGPNGWIFLHDHWPLLMAGFTMIIAIITFILIDERKRKKAKAEKKEKNGSGKISP